MQIDFHYYCVGVLARAAGFNSEDALAIAYASQYVDDSTEGELIPIATEKEIIKFDPTLTAYTKLYGLAAMSWSAQKRVWIPFHFLPMKPFDPGKQTAFSFITHPGSAFACLLLKRAAEEPLANHRRRLCRIGVALHTYADTWSHQAFSGRKYRSENNVEGVQVYHRMVKKWEHLTIENLLFDLLPQIGHAEAGYFPDLAYQKWKFTLKPTLKEVVRDNTSEFMKAAKRVHAILSDMEKSNPEEPVPWIELRPRIRRLLAETGEKPKEIERLTFPLYRAFHAQEVERRCQGWKEEFSALFGDLSVKYSYDRKTWREKALKGDVDWDDYTPEDWARMRPREMKENFWDSRWVHFHRAALSQRHFVLENIP